MAKKYLTLVTKRGKEKIMQATKEGKKVSLTKLKIGDAGGHSYSIYESQTALKNVVYETVLTNYSIDSKNKNTLVIEARIPSEAGPFYIREIGLFDEDDEMIVISSYEETYKPVATDGSTMELFVRIALILSNIDNIEIKIDSSIVMASKKDLEKIYSILGDLGTLSGDFSNTESFVEVVKELQEKIKGVKLKDTEIDVEGKSKKLNLVLKDYDREIEELKGKDIEISNTIKEYESAVNDYSDNLGIFVGKHKTANDKLEALLT